MRFRHLRVGVSIPLAVAALALVGCAGDSGSASSSQSGEPPRRQTVTVENYTYRPARITVPRGATVHFTNRDSTPHTATSSDPGAFDTDGIQPGRTAGVELRQPGTFTYYCVFHPFMKATVTVE